MGGELGAGVLPKEEAKPTGLELQVVGTNPNDVELEVEDGANVKPEVDGVKPDGLNPDGEAKLEGLESVDDGVNPENAIAEPDDGVNPNEPLGLKPPLDVSDDPPKILVVIVAGELLD